MATKGVLLRKALAPAEEGKILIWAWRIFSGSPTSTLEAMAVGLPTVAYRIPGMDEVVTHGESGLLAAVGQGSLKHQFNAIVQ